MDNVNQSAAPSPEEVFDALHDVMHRFRAQRHRVFSAAGQDLTPMEGKALGFFARHPGATLSELAEHSGRDRSQLARLIAGLRDRELLEARVDEADRRNIRLQLTPAAAELHRTMRQHSRKLAKQAIGTLDAAECAQLLDLLGRIRSQLDSTKV